MIKTARPYWANGGIMIKLLENCKLCPRNCGINRINGKVGLCGATDKLKVARASLHMWEEPCISGANGSGTVFFSHCSLKCIFCQNNNISQNNFGKEITIERLAEIFIELQDKNANNINLVTPSSSTISIIFSKSSSETASLSLTLDCHNFETKFTNPVTTMLSGLRIIFNI